MEVSEHAHAVARPRVRAPLSVIALVAALALTGCGGTTDAPATTHSTPSTPTPTAEPTPLDLTGSWMQSNSLSETNHMVATITSDSISVDWVLDAAEMPILDTDNDGEVVAVYWVGSFVAPTDAADSYSWNSVRDTAATDTAILASQQDSKDFTYANGILSFTVSIQGESATVEMTQQ